MRTSCRTSLAIAALALAVNVQPVDAQAKKPKVVILATGGTIAGAAASGTQLGYTSGAVGIDVMPSGSMHWRSRTMSMAS